MEAPAEGGGGLGGESSGAGGAAGVEVVLPRVWTPGFFAAVGALAVGAGLCVPIDGLLVGVLGGVELGGDVRRELEALQQFGQLSFSLLIAWAIALLDRERCRRLLDWLAAGLLTAVVLYPAKMLIGRPRPRFDDPFGFIGAFGKYPLDAERGMAAGWELGVSGVSDLWSMPSGHTAFAVVCAVFLWVAYPRIRLLAVTLAVITASGRLLLGAHYVSDVLAGAALGLAVAVPVVRGFGGVRGLDWVWKRTVDRRAEPAFPGLAARFETGASDRSLR
ncbi:MAG: phosphatase PAP2 family protein [Planctomycetota bacterium]